MEIIIVVVILTVIVPMCIMWYPLLKSTTTKPCWRCKHSILYDGFNCCYRCRSKIDGEPRLCSYARGSFECRFKERDGY